MSAEIILKALCVVGFIFAGVLVYRQIKKNRATPEGEAEWQKEMKHWKWNAGVGVLANFGDTLGIGSFAGSSAAFKLKKSVEDINIPGTLNVGDTFPVLMEAFLFFGFVDLDPLTLISMLAAATVGAFVGASFVTKWDLRTVRLGMGIGLLLLGLIMACRSLGVGPFGTTGNALELRGAKLVIGIVVNFFLGALMDLGCGLYAPCMALVSLLGMNVGAAFPIMMGSCAYLMAFGNTPQFVRENRFDMVATVCQGVFGVIGVLIAYFFVKSIPLTVLTWIVTGVVIFTSIMFFKDGVKTPKGTTH